MPQHDVKQGDHLSRIAAEAGFADFHTVWDHPENQALKDKRKNPQILLPGDTVFLPEPGQREESCATEQRHVFRVKAKPLKLRLTVKDFDDHPVANQKCELEVDGQIQELETNGSGLVETEIPARAEQGRLVVPALSLAIPFKIGHLDPVDEPSGWRGRLMNLGYFSPAADDSDPIRLRYALEEFQCDHKLKINGEADDATRAKLKEVHGC
jgi:hypothetical protein